MPQPSDAELVAYLDGELSPADSVRIGQMVASESEVKSRLEHLMRGGRPFAEAFDPLLADAPLARLEAALSNASARARPVSPSRKLPRAVGVGAALVFAALIGAGLDRFVVGPGYAPAPASVQDDAADWRNAVAEYLSLYTRETLANVPGSATERERGLDVAGARVGVRLSPDSVALEGLSLKRADIYRYDEKPLVFLGYLDAHDEPVALCITRGSGQAELKAEQREGMNVVYWSRSNRNFMLIGKPGPERLLSLAQKVQAQLAEGAGSPG